MKERVLGPFLLEEQLGVGGMGYVFRARHSETGQILALKLLSEEALADDKLVARFQRELEILQRLGHPHIVRCFGGGRLGEQRFFAMEFVPGGTVAELLQKSGRLPWQLVARIARQVCLALHHAHLAGVIHRDLKPANLLLDAEGNIKLTDFGLARLRDAMSLTVAGRTLGTHQYMAPEQINGKSPVSAQTDLYALGIVLFELLTGKPPFTSGAMLEILEAHLRQPIPRLIESAPDCPPQLVELVEQLLAKSPKDRPADALVVATRLAMWLIPEPDEATGNTLLRQLAQKQDDGRHSRPSLQSQYLPGDDSVSIDSALLLPDGIAAGTTVTAEDPETDSSTQEARGLDALDRNTTVPRGVSHHRTTTRSTRTVTGQSRSQSGSVWSVWITRWVDWLLQRPRR